MFLTEVPCEEPRTCGATLPYLKKLYSVLSDRLKMAYPPSEAVKLMFLGDFGVKFPIRASLKVAIGILKFY